MNFIAHAPEHELVDHLTAVAQGAAAAVDTASAPWAHLAGLWHDLGKFRPGFQSYVRQDDEAHIEGRGVVGRDKTHSAAGAVHALQTLKQRFGEPGRQVGWLLAHLIAAHHAGLYDAAELQERLIGGTRADSEREHQEAVAACASHAPELLALPEALDAEACLLYPPYASHEPSRGDTGGPRIL